MDTFNYSIYGLAVKSSRKIELLAPVEINNTDLNITWRAENQYTDRLDWTQIITPDLKNRKGITFFKSESIKGTAYKIYFETNFGYLYFILDQTAKELIIVFPLTIPDSDLDSFFVGAIIGAVLRLKGTLCLHASVINIEEKAVIIMGSKRSGKSTSAAYFNKLGYEILADDLGTISEKNEAFFVEPGYSKIRLRPKSYDFFIEEKKIKSPLVYSDRESRYVDLAENTKYEALQIAAIFHLKQVDNSKPIIKEYSQIEKIIHLNRNTFGNYVVQKKLRKKEFNQINQLSNAIPVIELETTHNLGFLPKQCQLILAFLKENNLL
jgi:hypothetical protein